MNTMNYLPSERRAVLQQIPPQLVDNATVTGSSWIDVAKIGRLLAVLHLGAVDITSNFKIEKATASDGTGATPHVAATQITAGGDNTIVQLNVLCDNLGEGYQFVRMSFAGGDGAAGSYMSAILYGYDIRYNLEKDSNIAAVAETVVS